ncbi:MAG: DUF2336 domain-containing protein [Proteobacteria bacterium]|nr:DUF2336 domain-containing protein [Pseudomonadota bacterium]
MELSKEDIARLLADPSPHTRADVAVKVGRRLADMNLAESEMALSQDIVRHLARDLAVQVRAALAVSVKSAKRLPRDVALRLARDVEEVSLPVLEHSTLLTDEDLLEIISGQSAAKQQAIARRENVSEKVSEALVEKGTEQVVTTLFNNPKAKIAEKTFDKAIHRFGDQPQVQESMVRRQQLPLAVAERLVARVSEALREHLIVHHDLPRDLISDVIMQSRERATVDLLGGSRQDVLGLVRQLKETGRLTPSLILRALCVGDISFFEASLAVLAGIPLSNAQALVHDKGKLGLKSLYDKTALPPGMYPILLVALEVVQETPLTGGERDRDRTRARVIERILTQCQDFNQEDLNYLLDKLSDLLDKAA